MKKFDFTISGNKYAVHIKDIEENIANIDVNGTTYSIEIHREIKQTKTPTLVRRRVKQQPGEGVVKKAAPSSIKSPLPGNIFKVIVKDGDVVKKGDPIFVLEAMKMENQILAEKDCVIKAIKVSEGQAVLQNDVLAELE